MFKIVKTPENAGELDELRKKLTVTPLTNSPVPFQRPQQIRLFLESQQSLRIPFAYAVNKGKVATKDDVARRIQAIEANATKVNFAFNDSLTLRDYQSVGCAKVIHSLKTTCGGLLCSSTGSGKSLMGVYVISQMKMKTLILVHKEFLMSEFFQTIEKCMPGTTVSKIQGPVCDTSGDIVIAMIQSIMTKDYPREMWKSFGIVLADEVHHLPAAVYGRSIMGIECAYTVGLSATPKRSDGLKPEWLIGKLAYNYQQVTNNKPECHIIDYHDEKPIEFVFNKAGVLNSSAMCNNLVLDQDRNRLIVDSLETIYRKNEDDIEENPETPRRFTLVTSDRRGHLEQLYDLIQEREVLKKYKTGFSLGGMKKVIFDDFAKNSDILLATYQMISEGFNQPRLNCICLVTAKSNIVQTIGRILRKDHVGITPLIVDINDCAIYSYIPSMRKRLALYKSREYPIIHCNTLDLDRVLDVEEEQAGGVVDGVPLAPSGEIDFSQCLL